VGRPILSTAARNLATSLPPAAAPSSGPEAAAAGPSSLRSAAARSAPSASAAWRSSSDARGAGSGSPSPASSARSHATASDRRRRSSPLPAANQPKQTDRQRSAVGAAARPRDGGEDDDERIAGGGVRGAYLTRRRRTWVAGFELSCERGRRRTAGGDARALTHPGPGRRRGWVGEDVGEWEATWLSAPAAERALALELPVLGGFGRRGRWPLRRGVARGVRESTEPHEEEAKKEG